MELHVKALRKMFRGVVLVSLDRYSLSPPRGIAAGIPTSGAKQN
jgi:hypothetical protein